MQLGDLRVEVLAIAFLDEGVRLFGVRGGGVFGFEVGLDEGFLVVAGGG